MPELRATTDVVTALGDVLIRHPATPRCGCKLVKGERRAMFEMPYPVTVSADLYGELKACSGRVASSRPCPLSAPLRRPLGRSNRLPVPDVGRGDDHGGRHPALTAAPPPPPR